MTNPTLTFSIEITGSSSHNCWHETMYRLRQLNAPFTEPQMQSLAGFGMLGSGQELRYDLARQEREDSGDGMNYYHVLMAKRICDSGD